MTKQGKKTEMVNIRLTPEDYAVLKIQAEGKGISIAQHTRNIILKNLSLSPLSDEIMKPDDILRICKIAFSEYLESEEFKIRQKVLIKETLKEMIE
ncbi:MAG: hypothetical protein PHP59_04930 [Methanofollis sp.]|uniref:plasmid mobilization protein n=1 Tax=Methanofollis sp. TaxID=2052835 RepID=UPI0026130AAB|nr:hypothetical protein [Methanofollis sp.]MDD4254703.1 hypothetical protein [Methanofollis sp.]